MMVIPFLFGSDDSLWVRDSDRVVQIRDVGQSGGVVNLGNVQYETDAPDYVGKPIIGQEDPTQVAMARELLGLYKEVIQAQSSLVSKVSEEAILIGMLGTHYGEVDTYSHKKYRSLGGHDLDETKPLQTHIPMTYVKWSDYGRVRTADNKEMSFKDYTWKDFQSKYKSENPNNMYLGVKDSNPLYESGLNYPVLRSYTGALGPLQMQPETWNNNKGHMYGGDYSGSKPAQIMNLEGYMTEFVVGRAVNYYDSQYYDIFNLANLAYANVNWQEEFHKVSDEDTTKTIHGINRDKTEVIQMYFHFRYYGGSPSDISGDRETYFEDLDKLARDPGLHAELAVTYESKFGHGADEEIIYRAYERNGWSRTSNGGVTKTTPKGTITLNKTKALHPIRGYYQGKVGLDLLRRLAFNVTASPRIESLGKVRYNYMTADDGTVKISQSVREDAVDKIKAIGYKGPYPIFDQSGDYMRNYYILNQYGAAETFSKSACTVFAMTSMAHGVGPTPTLNRELDVDRNGVIDPFEWWIGGRAMAGRNTYNVASKPPVGTGLLSIKGILKNAGYTVKEPIQGSGSLSTKDNNLILSDLRNKIPHHIRVWYQKKDKSGKVIATKTYKGYVPNIDPDKLDYNIFNMYDESNYNPTLQNIKLATNQHSVIGVEARQIHGRWAISIVNSTGHHNGNHDTNLIWFDAEDLLGGMEYAGGYAIKGATNNPDWKITLWAGSQNALSDSGIESKFMGISYEEALTRIDNITYKSVDDSTLKLEVKDGTGSQISIKGKFETKVVSRRTDVGTVIPDEYNLLLYIGDYDGEKTVLEFSNIKNPKTNAVWDMNSGDYTELFELKYPTVATIRMATLSKDGTLNYIPFFENDSAE